MTTPHSPRPTGAPGVRHLLTAVSLATTLSGWALFTAAQPPQAGATLLAPAAAAAAPPGWLSAPPLPTLVTVATVAAPVAPVAAPAAPVAAPLGQLSAPPPAPVTTTRSSR